MVLCDACAIGWCKTMSKTYHSVDQVKEIFAGAVSLSFLISFLWSLECSLKIWSSLYTLFRAVTRELVLLSPRLVKLGRRLLYV